VESPNQAFCEWGVFLLLSSYFFYFLLLPLSTSRFSPLYPAMTRTGTKAVQQKAVSFRSGIEPACEGYDLVSAGKSLAICWNNFGVLKEDDWLPNHP
jgi:hypothetical protein